MLSTDFDSLVEALKDKDIKKREKAAYLLLNIKKKDARAVEPLIAILLDYELDDYIRTRAVGALGLLKDARAIEPLIVVMHLKSESGRTAPLALASIGAPSVEPLISLLNHDKDSIVREASAYALGLLKDARAIEPLIAAIGNDNFGVMQFAARALKKITGISFLKGVFLGRSWYKWQRWWEQNKESFQKSR